MSFESELQRIKEQIISHLPPNIVVQKIEFEGPEIAVYSENTNLEVIESSEVLKELAKTMRKREIFWKGSCLGAFGNGYELYGAWHEGRSAHSNCREYALAP